MINFIDLNKSLPYKIFLKHYRHALKQQQSSIEAICISSFNVHLGEVSSRYVNLKYIKDTEWIFFSNYNSPKSQDFISHNQIAATIFWDSIKLQIRIKAKITNTDSSFSDEHFNLREREKNSLSISSDQSARIESFSKIEKNFKDVHESDTNHSRPNYWGGFSFTPYYFEFWEGGEFRLNKRNAYTFQKDCWKSDILQP